MLRFALVTTLVLSSCGPAFLRPECKTVYDDCMNACEGKCEQRPIEETGTVVSTWDAACQGCTDACQDQAKSCQANVPQ